MLMSLIYVTLCPTSYIRELLMRVSPKAPYVSGETDRWGLVEAASWGVCLMYGD